ncbi:uncharacterized protein BXZ73DRAFT_40427 [Epithele typhae]|uniref:uncharacterized protein n=1 Tax=Epithele typhae TaxID=378194 RepID=UPI002008CCB8|nr:uncharacterized protein BXZ73DRAFT_40427 [Epithele typhae]KAH9943252.1 hypothetical protein BXZ73DRAFT_40427 [Epithele typhae]
MLGARTKQIFAYGKRGQRVVNAYDERKSRHLDLDSTQEGQAGSVSAHSFKEISVVSGHPSKSIPSSSNASENHTSVRAKQVKRSPKVAKVGGAVAVKPVRRLPLGSIPPNAPSSPAVPPTMRKKRWQTVMKASPLVPNSLVVDIDIVVLDSQGIRVSQEHRISKGSVQTNVYVAMSPKRPRVVDRMKPRATGKRADPISVSDSEDGRQVLKHNVRNARANAKPIVISDSDDGSESDYTPTKDGPAAYDESSEEELVLKAPRFRRRGPSRAVISPSPTPSILSFHESVVTLPAPAPAPGPQRSRQAPPSEPPRLPPAPPQPLQRHVTLPPKQARRDTLGPFTSLPSLDAADPTRSKPRQLTPIRKRPGQPSFPAPPSPPSPTTPSDLNSDLDFDFAQLALSPGALAEVQRLDFGAPDPGLPEYVVPLLNECSQTTAHEFSAFIDMFPFDPIVREGHGSSTHATFQKIGEACYSEVFGIGDVVLKIIPLRDEARSGLPDAAFATKDSPEVSDAKDVLKEILVTRAMGSCCAGFTELLRAYVVRGKYPSLLLDLWDDYDKQKGSESVRPDSFSVSQLYAIIVLPNGGPDLEAFTFSTPTKTGWRQACSLFWQVTRTLAEAEELVHFEHRDLHWGQILVKNVPLPTPRKSDPKSSSSSTTTAPPLSMDDPAHGVLATVIDLGLSRMDDGSGTGAPHWTPFDPEIFAGEGDEQFDVYRQMRAHIASFPPPHPASRGGGDGDWAAFHPRTNAMWLGYLARKLLHAKRLRAPPATRPAERAAHECLREVTAVLPVAAVGAGGRQEEKGKPRRGRPRKTHAPDVAGPGSATELWEMGLKKGWVW